MPDGGYFETIKYSWYNPELGGINCSRFIDGICVSNMASGKSWLPYVDRAAACPSDWGFGTVVILDGKEWVCEDRGGAIKYDTQGYTFVDFLTKSPTYSYGEYIEIYIVPKN